MRQIRIAGLCLIAVLAMGAITAGAASAESLPYYGTYNAKTKTTTPLAATLKVAFTNVGQGPSKLEGLVSIQCQGDSGKGDLEGPKKTVKLKVVFTGCESPAITSKCETSLKAPGVIETVPLKGELTYASETSGGPLHVANKFIPEKGTEYARFSCGPKEELLVVVFGVVLTEAAPVNAPPSKTGETILAEKLVEQGFNCTKQALLFENGAGKCQHLGTFAGPAWDVAKDTVTFKKAITLVG